MLVTIAIVRLVVPDLLRLTGRGVSLPERQRVAALERRLHQAR